jgi:hypothetical protein
VKVVELARDRDPDLYVVFDNAFVRAKGRQWLNRHVPGRFPVGELQVVDERLNKGVERDGFLSAEDLKRIARGWETPDLSPREDTSVGEVRILGGPIELMKPTTLSEIFGGRL